jgi:hypothetical protein
MGEKLGKHANIVISISLPTAESLTLELYP